MATYYVGTGGNNASAGTSWGARWLTLTKAASVVAAGDTVYCQGTFRETLTPTTSGTAGNPVTWFGDYMGTHTSGSKAVVRITGSDNDQTATRARAINCSSVNFQTFRGFQLDTVTTEPVKLAGCTDIEVTDCDLFGPKQNQCVTVNGAGGLRCAFRRCRMRGTSNGITIYFTHSSTVSNAAHVVENCVLENATGSIGVYTERVGGITVKNCLITGQTYGVLVGIALAAAQTVTVRECLIDSTLYGFVGATLGDIDEDYNNLFNLVTPRSTCNTGTHSTAYSTLLDTRPLFESWLNSGRVVTPYDLSSASQLINLADGGTASTADARGTTVIGGNREPGVFEYDSTLTTGGSSSSAAYPVVGGGFIRGSG